MAELVFLGTAKALPSISQENTYVVLRGGRHTVLVDCGGSPYRRLLQAGINPQGVDNVILTHSHPDHVYGVPALIMALWLAGRKGDLTVHGPDETCDLTRHVVNLYHPESWPGMFSVRYHPVPMVAGALVLDNADFRVTAVPVSHMVPTIGLRVLNHLTEGVLAYSSDTEPSQGVRELARGARLLVHEATGAISGHSSAEQAGTAAHEAGVEHLVLMHHNLEDTAAEVLVRRARRTYSGLVSVARDFDRFTW